MGRDFRLEELPGLGEPLRVIDVGVGRDQHLAFAERKIHLPNQLDDLFDGFLQADDRLFVLE